jgi:hypothetical protein
MLASPNPNGRPNSEVIRPWVNASDLTGRFRGLYIIDFNAMPVEEAAFYEQPFEYVLRFVKPSRDTNRRDHRRLFWWHHGETVPSLRKAISGIDRYIATPRVAKHRIFVWVPANTLPDSRVFAIARDDDYFFGVLQSRLHEVWALATSSRHGVGNDPTYNNTTCFETFSFPTPDTSQETAIAEAAQKLNSLREEWLNPTPVNGLPLPQAELNKRTMTNLYNLRPTWLTIAQTALDEAVFAAYGWPCDLSESEILGRLIALNAEREPA